MLDFKESLFVLLIFLSTCTVPEATVIVPLYRTVRGVMWVRGNEEGGQNEEYIRKEISGLQSKEYHRSEGQLTILMDRNSFRMPFCRKRKGAEVPFKRKACFWLSRPSVYSAQTSVEVKELRQL